MSFDDVLLLLVRTCEQWPQFQSVKRAVLVRDIAGRARLFLEIAPGKSLSKDSLSTLLKDALGAWFPDDVYVGANERAHGRLTGTILDNVPKTPWTPEYESAPGTAVKVKPGRWFLIERRLSKLAWLDPEPTGELWGLSGRTPTVVTFFSYKGGVGRSTLMAAAALHLARSGKRVLAIDLDLEAPGIGLLLGANGEGRGVIDFVVDHVGTGRTDIDDLISQASAAGAESNLVEVIPAGMLNRQFFEKLARLDFVGGLGTASKQPVKEALTALLRATMKRSPAPDFIFLDARAGLHDLAGLSLHGLAHIDVLVARDSEQSYRGLELVVEVVGQARGDRAFRAIVVHSMAPSDKNSEEARRVEGEFRDRSYRAFEKYVYDDAPAVEDTTASHSPWVVRFTDLLQRFVSLDSIRETLLGADYARIAERVVELATPEPPP